MGITLFSLFKWKIELWFCPPFSKVPEHTHPHVDIELIPLYGSAIFSRNGVLYPLCRGRLFKCHTVKHNDRHYFVVSSKWLIFLNWEKWLDNKTSAAVDFQLT